MLWNSGLVEVPEGFKKIGDSFILPFCWVLVVTGNAKEVAPPFCLLSFGIMEGLGCVGQVPATQEEGGSTICCCCSCPHLGPCYVCYDFWLFCSTTAFQLISILRLDRMIKPELSEFSNMGTMNSVMARSRGLELEKKNQVYF